jgi:hypothetical protein
MKKKLPAYGAQMIQREWQGVQFNLVVLALADWDAGKEYAGADVWRMVVPADMPPNLVKLDWAAGRDVLLVGDVDRAEQMVRPLIKAQSNSIWVDFGGLIHRVSILPSGQWVAVSDAVAQAGFRSMLERYSNYQLLVGEGVFACSEVDQARQEMLRELGAADG